MATPRPRKLLGIAEAISRLSTSIAISRTGRQYLAPGRQANPSPRLQNRRFFRPCYLKSIVGSRAPGSPKDALIPCRNQGARYSVILLTIPFVPGGPRRDSPRDSTQGMSPLWQRICCIFLTRIGYVGHRRRRDFSVFSLNSRQLQSSGYSQPAKRQVCRAGRPEAKRSTPVSCRFAGVRIKVSPPRTIGPEKSVRMAKYF